MKKERLLMTKNRKQKTFKKHFLSSHYLLLATLILMWFLLLHTVALAATIYVDNQLTEVCYGTYSIANRDCSGSDGDAYFRPQDAADVVQPGDTVYFREGTYYQHDDMRDRIVVMNILRNGTPDNPITFKNYNNEEVIFSAMRPGTNGHFRALTLGIAPSSQADISGQGVQNIVIDGLIVEGASAVGLDIYGPANRYGPEENPTENVTIRNVIARNNIDGTNSRGISTAGKLVNVVIEDCEAYNNTGPGISFWEIARTWHEPEPENDMSAAQHSVIRNCLVYDNVSPTAPGNTDGIQGFFLYNCTIENNVVFGNSDDGIDMYASIESTAKKNIIFDSGWTGGNGAGIKFSAGGGGRHTIAGNVVFNNKGYSFESSDPKTRYREYYPSRIYSNLAYNGSDGFSLGTGYSLTYAGFEKVYLRDNIGLDNVGHDIKGGSGCTDSDYNFFSSLEDLDRMQSQGLDLHSLTGDPGIVNKNVVIDTNFGADWTIQQKLEHIRSQVKAAFSLTSQSQLIDAGVVVAGYHCDTAGAHPGESCCVWYGDAPDIGAYEYTLLPVAVIQNEPKQGYAPLTVSFDGSQSKSPHGDIVSYEWDLGDGTTSTKIKTKHIFTSIGEYTVTLTVTDELGLKGKSQTHIIVFEKEFGELPTGCYNNVFNPTKGEKALIVVELPKQSHVRLNLYNTRGDKIRELADEEKEAGTHKYYWDGKSGNGNVVGSGLYFVHIQAGDYKKTRKIVVIK